MSTVKTVTVQAEGVTLSGMVWQTLKRQPVGFVEAVLDFNPGLAKLGPYLPVGTVVNFPLDAISAQQPTRQVVRLWD